MKALRISADAKLVESDVPEPRPGAGQLLICVIAAGITPTELQWYPTTHSSHGGKRSDAIPGHEFSGIVAALGEGVNTFSPGQEVFGMNDWFTDGATAEYCVAPAAAVAAKPTHISHVEAASVPIAALTAWQGLFERAKLRAGETVLVQGGAGSVGSFAVQLARNGGARVIASASAAQLEFVKQLGAEEVLDYRATRFEDKLKNVDVVFDTVGGETLRRSWSVLALAGRMATVAAAGENTTDERTKNAFFIVEPNQLQLEKIGELLEERRIVPVVDAVVPFADVAAAYTGQFKGRTGRGKLVAAIASEATQLNASATL